MVLTPEMQQVGVTSQLLTACHRFDCPQCGKEFSMFQSRAIACKGCPSANKDCKYVRCPHCDSHFPIDGTLVNSKEKGHFMSNYMNSIVNNYYNSFGKMEKR